jgi:hypothetical protein
LVFKIIFIAFILSLSAAQAATPSFNNISRADLETIASDFAAVFVHTSVSPASTLGEQYGFELGFVMGAVQVPGIEELVKKSNPDADQVSMIPHAGLLGMITLPSALTFEVSFLPAFPLGGLQLSYQAIAVKWTLTNELPPQSLDMALRAHFANAVVAYDQEILTVPTEVKITEQVTGLTAVFSRKMLILEPYFGVGLLSAKGTASFDGQESFAFTDNSSASANNTGMQAYVGLNISLSGARFGFEAGRVFDSNKATAKVAVFF